MVGGRRCHCHYRPRRRAFTLIELLVVVGIIATLIAILLPALNASRESARRVVCGSGLRTMGQAFHMYAGESKGWLPQHLFNPNVPAGAFNRDSNWCGDWLWDLS